MQEEKDSFVSRALHADLLLIDVVRAVIDRHGDGEWEVQPADFWCYVKPPVTGDRDQGWKLHVSATPLSAPLVLAHAAEVLVRHRCHFKFARDVERVESLVSRNCDRGLGGKFITVYPADDMQFQRLAEELDRVTDGLPGPRILSDGHLRPGSLVHYRFGVFSANAVFTNEGGFESVLTAPDGSHVKDERLPWFSPPEWALSPLAEAASLVVPTKPEVVRLGDRFVVHKAIKHSNGGGVYVAQDDQTGQDVILKQARQHTGGRRYGTDSTHDLRHEAEMLDLFAPLGITPLKVALFGQQGDLFLAEELVPGVGLRRWAAEQVFGVYQGDGLPLDKSVDLGRQLVEIMAAVHGLGLVARDFTPNNLMVTPEGRLRLVDLEFAMWPGDRGTRAYTPGYAPPEQAEAPQWGPAPQPSVDLFGLGTTLFYLVTATDPVMPDDEPEARPLRERLEGLISSMAVKNTGLRALAPLILGLVHENPDERWSLDRARRFLATVADGPLVVATPGTHRLSPTLQQRLLEDGLTYVVRTMTPDSRRLWTSTGHGDEADPCAVQYGAAGVLAVLTRAAQLPGGEELRAPVRTVARWIDQRRFDIPVLLPGLYFGRAGTAWALHDAARYLDDSEMARHAVELAKRLPIPWPNPDVCHGTAGAGLAHLHLWQTTGDEQFKSRALKCADAVLAAGRDRGGSMLWPIPTDFNSSLAGLSHYGFAHGVAGAGAFLLTAGLAFDRDDYLKGARVAGDTLESVANVKDGAARWPSGEEGDLGFQHWCSGASGIGTFLIRLWRANGERRFLKLAHQAAVTLRRNKWQAGTAACHGLAGDADFLIDLADLTGESKYRAWAEELAAAIHARHAYRDGLMVVGGEHLLTINADYNTGLAGVLGLLLRLRHGGPRWWMVDEPLLARNLRLSVGGV
ncbi:class IV lanthionine synthetase LanL [Streptomyces sp. NPDC002659]|uniref:class IV lanthionine synthetase LanL n=1 Tax=Streptomyces sp. NPDC002659 TaxID=3364656 RepID=UPI0036B73509